MASLSHLNQLLRTNTLSTTHLNSTPSISPPTTAVWIPGKPAGRSRIAADVPKRVVYTKAVTSDDEWGPEPSANVAVAEEKPAETDTETEKLKKALVDSFYGTDRGLKATSETRAEIVELITQLEAKNPTPAPTDALPLLNGKWILA